MNARSWLMPITLSVVLATTGCSSHDDEADDDSVAEGELGTGASSLARGRYVIKGSTDAARAILEVFLLSNGAFYANFRTNQSSVPGHQYKAAGTFALEPPQQPGGKEHLVFSYSLDPQFAPRGDRYEVERRANGELELRFVSQDTRLEAFVMEHTGKSTVATITFGDDWSVRKTGKLVADGVVALRYARSRAECDSPTIESFASVDGARARSLAFPGQFDATMTVAMPVPVGDRLAFWFRNVGGYVACEGWDSDYGRNFSFKIR